MDGGDGKIDSSAALHIFNLKQRGHHIPVIARWLFDEWGHLRPSGTLEGVIQRMANRCRGNGLPSVYVAELKDIPVGTISLIERDMDIRSALIPWVAAVYVQPQYRNRGIGSALMRHIETVGVGLGFERLYLFTPNKQSMYSKLGWEVLENLVYKKMNVSIMVRDLKLNTEKQ